MEIGFFHFIYKCLFTFRILMPFVLCFIYLNNAFALQLVLSNMYSTFLYRLTKKNWTTNFLRRPCFVVAFFSALRYMCIFKVFATISTSPSTSRYCHQDASTTIRSVLDHTCILYTDTIRIYRFFCISLFQIIS